MRRKHLFSLIEIAVAMAVAAIGVAAIMALLPIAIKSSSDSVGDTLSADAANTILAQLDWVAWGNYGAIYNLPASKPSPFPDTKSADYAKMQLDKDTSYKIEPEGGLQEGHFAFLFGPSVSDDGNDNAKDKKPDFAAEVFCWKEDPSNLSISLFDSPNGVPVSSVSHPETNMPPLVRVYIEISWPMSKPYEKNSVYPRESRVFVRDYFDPTYYNEKKSD